MINKRDLKEFARGSTRFLYHIGLAGLSAAIALSLPRTVGFIAKKVLIYWSLLENEKLLVVGIEMTAAVLLLFFFNLFGKSWRARRFSNMAKEAGLVMVQPVKGFFSRRRAKRLKERKGFAKDVLVIGSTGFRTFVDPKGDLHHVLQNCRRVMVMLVDPFSEGAVSRAKSILDPHVTPEIFQEQVRKSILFLKELKAVKKEVRLKLYPDAPLLKLAVLDDYVWIQHYHSGIDIRQMPEYVFKHGQSLSSLYIPLYQYFMARWNNPDTPEYDLDADVLIYRDVAGNELRREKFEKWNQEARPLPVNGVDHRRFSGHPHGYPPERMIFPL